MSWTDIAAVKAALGPSTPIPDDGWLDQCVAAANAAAYRKRVEAGYTDDPDTAPDAAVAVGTTMWAVALWRARSATDGYASFEDLSAYTPALSSWGEIRRMLGIGRAAVDRPAAYVAPYRNRRISVNPRLTP